MYAENNISTGQVSVLLDMLSAGLDEYQPLTGEELRLSLEQMLLSAISAAMIPEMFSTISGEEISFTVHHL